MASSSNKVESSGEAAPETPVLSNCLCKICLCAGRCEYASFRAGQLRTGQVRQAVQWPQCCAVQGFNPRLSRPSVLRVQAARTSVARGVPDLHKVVRGLNGLICAARYAVACPELCVVVQQVLGYALRHHMGHLHTT